MAKHIRGKEMKKTCLQQYQQHELLTLPAGVGRLHACSCCSWRSRLDIRAENGSGSSMPPEKVARMEDRGGGKQ